jgi:hypothetical protein
VQQERAAQAEEFQRAMQSEDTPDFTEQIGRRHAADLLTLERSLQVSAATAS